MAILTGSISLDLFSIFIALFAIIYATFKWIFQTWKRKGIPYFEPTFPFGNLQPFYKSVPQSEDVFNIIKQAKNNGWKYFGLFFNMKPFFVPLDLELIKCILAKDFNYFSDRVFYHNEKDDPLSGNLFTLGGKKWRKLRTIYSPTFTSGKMRGMFQNMVDCSLVLEDFLKARGTGEPLDCKRVFSCYTANVIGSCGFGLDCNSFEEPDSPFVTYGKKVLTLNTFRKLKELFMITFPELSRSLHLKLLPPDVSKFYYGIVSTTVNYREQNNITRNDFLQLLINVKNNKGEESSKDDGASLTMDQIAAQCFSFFLAGFDTSSSTMMFALFELARQPDLQEKVREELFSVFNKYDNQISYDSIKELKYMHQVIQEILRKYPPLPVITRRCMEEYKIPGTDITLAKGTGVMISIKNIHYCEDIYENSDEFDPERFSAEETNKRHPYAYIPFGEGPRICIGMRFGFLQTKVGLATILKNFRVTVNHKTKIPLKFDPRTNLAPTPIGGIWLNLEKL